MSRILKSRKNFLLGEKNNLDRVMRETDFESNKFWKIRSKRLGIKIGSEHISSLLDS